jgi:hypothetical protein
MSSSSESSASVGVALKRITEAWGSGQPQLMAPLLDEHIVMVFPDFTGRLTGRDAFIESFTAFGREASVLEYTQRDLQVDGTREVAIAQYQFEMLYEREGERWLATGWDIWVFRRSEADWRAVWRTMQALKEEPAP